MSSGVVVIGCDMRCVDVDVIELIVVLVVVAVVTVIDIVVDIVDGFNMIVVMWLRVTML